jgi:hypothetical protein
MAMPMTYDAAKAAALKVLGNDAKIPPPSSAIKTSGDQDGKAYDAFDKSRKDLEAKLLALQNVESAWRNALRQYDDALQASNFGLDDKDDDDAKKIDQAQKLFAAWADGALAVLDRNIKNLDELDKHLMNISKYNHGECK